MCAHVMHETNCSHVKIVHMICSVNSKYLYKNEQYVDNDEEILPLKKMRTSEIRSQYRWCWRRVLRVSWMERKKNIPIIENIKPEWTLESRVTKAALSYFGHVVRAGGMEDDVMLGRMNGARNRGRPRQRWLHTLKEYASGATISNLRRDARDRAGWRGATTAVARGRIRLDGTR